MQRRMGGRFASDVQSASMTPRGMERMNRRMYDTPHVIVVRESLDTPVTGVIGPFTGSMAAFDYARDHGIDVLNVWSARSARCHYGAVPIAAPDGAVQEA